VIGSFKKTGHWKKIKATKKWELITNWADDGKIIYDFSQVDTDSIKRIETKYQQDLEYSRILTHLKQTTAFRSFSGIRKMFTDKGLNISTSEIEDLYWDEKYDKEYYNTLKRKADEIFVSDEEFVFIIRMDGREFRIVERPVQNSATYIFNDTCDMPILLERLKITKKFDIIRNAMTDRGEQLQAILGYKGRVVHQDYEGWLSKIQTTIGDGVEQELIDRFIW
jgi:guanylate kinase